MTDDAIVSEIERYFGFCEETQRNVAEATAEMHIDASALNPGIPSDVEMDFPGSMGRGKNTHRPGPYVPTPSCEGGSELKFLTRMLYFTLGEMVTEITEGAGTGLDPDAVIYYDASDTSYSSKKTAFKDSTANDVTIPGHASAEVGDILYIGYSQKFAKINYTVGTAKTDVSTLVYEYWDGNEWKTLTVTDATTGFTVAGSNTVTFTSPSDWILKSINSSGPLYFIRIRCNAFTSAGVAGAITSGSLDTAPDVSTSYIWSSNKTLLPSFTSFCGMDVNEHIIAGCVSDKFEISADKDFINFKLDMKGGTVEPVATLKSLDELTLNPDYPLAYYEIDLHMRPLNSQTAWGDDTKISYKTQKLTLSFENSIDEKLGQHIGSRFPAFLPAGERKLELSFDSAYLDNTWIELLWGSETGPQERQGSTEVEFAVHLDAGVYGEMWIWYPRVIITGAPVDSKGRETIVQSVTVTPYNQTITVPTTPTQTIKTDCLVTSTLKFTDTSGSFDGPSEFGATA